MTTDLTADVLRDLRAEVEYERERHAIGQRASQRRGWPDDADRAAIGECDWFLAAIDARLAAQPKPSAPDGLDVERLATALWSALYRDPAGRVALDNVHDIAAAYALAPATPESREVES